MVSPGFLVVLFASVLLASELQISPACDPGCSDPYKQCVTNAGINIQAVCNCVEVYIQCVKANCGINIDQFVNNVCSTFLIACPALTDCNGVPTSPITLPPNLPPFTLPPGAELPPSLTLPPGVTFPPSLTIPPSVTLPPVVNTPTRTTPTRTDAPVSPVAQATCPSAKDCQSCVNLNSANLNLKCRWCENGNGCANLGTSCSSSSSGVFAFPRVTQCGATSVADIKDLLLTDTARVTSLISAFQSALKNYANIPSGASISSFGMSLADNTGKSLKFALAILGDGVLDAALTDLCNLAKSMVAAGYGVDTSRISCDGSLLRAKRDAEDSDEALATTTVTGTVTDGGGGLSGGAIAGIVIGVLLGVGLIIGIIAFFVISNNRNSAAYNDYSAM